MTEKYQERNIHKIGYLDVETSGLAGDFDFLLTNAILVRDIDNKDKNELRIARINQDDFDRAKKDHDARTVDSRILKIIIKQISDIDLLVGHWFIGKHRHDIPFLRTRCAINRIKGFPHYGMVRYGDTQKWGSTIHRLSSNGLEKTSLAYNAHIHKTPVNQKQWVNAGMFGFKEDVDYIMDHNIKDVKLTQFIHKHMEEYVPIPSTFY